VRNEENSAFRIPHSAFQRAALDRLADAVAAAIPIERLERIIVEGVPPCPMT
jgi:hypothetical protein